MSDTTLPITARHLRYVAEHTNGDDAFLTRLKRAAREAGIPAIWIAPEQASLMQILLRVARARRVVEVGTLAGYSAIAMARALPAGGTVRTIELDPVHAEFAERWIARSDVADRIRVYRGAGAEVLAHFGAGSADAAFLDADKPGYPVYLRHCLRIVRASGLIMIDNAFAFGRLLDRRSRDRDVSAVRALNLLMKKTTRLQGVIVPLGDGLWVAVRR
jgi:predicted O-methyltransferase YrrM